MLTAAHIAALVLGGRQRQLFAYSADQLSGWNPVTPAAPVSRLIAPAASHITVHINGNFGGTFNVTGMGAGASSRSDNLIDIVTNRPLTFSTFGFTSIQENGSDAPAIGSIGYEMQMYAGTSSSVGAALTGAVSGTDTGFNGQTLTLGGGSIPGDNRVVLRLSRTLTLSQVAKGGKDYTATGTISVSIN